jgi:uncharacterized protein YndB with AHSA1/START domain
VSGSPPRRPALVVVQRVLPAPPDTVYGEWLDADGMMEWMCPRPVQPTGIHLDNRVGGNLGIQILDDGREMRITGHYLVLDRPNRIQFTWAVTGWEAASPDSVVTVILEPHGDDQTLMTIHHARLPEPEIESYNGGWAKVAEQLERSITASA